MDTLSANHFQIASFIINTDKGDTLNIYPEPMNANLAGGNKQAVYALYRSNSEHDNIFNHLSIPGEIGENIPGLDDINKKDYLGEINLADNQNGWEYEGEKLSASEQKQVAEHLKLRRT